MQLPECLSILPEPGYKKHLLQERAKRVLDHCGSRALTAGAHCPIAGACCPQCRSAFTHCRSAVALKPSPSERVYPLPDRIVHSAGVRLPIARVLWLQSTHCWSAFTYCRSGLSTVTEHVYPLAERCRLRALTVGARCHQCWRALSLVPERFYSLSERCGSRALTVGARCPQCRSVLSQSAFTHCQITVAPEHSLPALVVPSAGEGCPQCRSMFTHCRSAMAPEHSLSEWLLLLPTSIYPFLYRKFHIDSSCNASA
ncbi:hypothetical protein AMTR_s00079p00101760 [Amborella trichopoda]|uniref:Uncharacterized protein n=1 Tax=Amborella trichopoda TaxID=13333 RepID=W1P7Q9_AMBTC|nr:hypothetical protein AMTR_s00079p00101760 [Amborella trichopoda]